jgi:ankyrin repeat protein
MVQMWQAVAKQVLDHGADVASAKHNGETALVFAAVDGHEAGAKQWLDHGADMAATSHNVVTA